VNTLILADCDDNIKKLFRIVQRAYLSMPEDLRPMLDRGGGSQYSYYFPDRQSRISVALKSRGETVHRLHISEAAFIQDTTRIDATTETVPIKNGLITYETTANGMNNHFYDFWHDDNGYMPFFFPWFFHDEYAIETEPIDDYTGEEIRLKNHVRMNYGFDLTDEQIAFRRFKMRTNKSFQQEYAEDDESCFLTSGKKVFTPDVLKRLMRDLAEPIERKDEWLKIWEPYDKNKYYAIGADTAEGYGGDYSVAVVLEARTRKQVAMIRSNRWKPREFAEQIFNLAKMYHGGNRLWPLVGVELNNHGHSVVQKLEDLIYPNLYEYKDDRSGWLTNKVTRPLMLDALIDGVEAELVEFLDKDFFKEALTLVDNDGKLEAAKGKNDDIIIASAIALQMAIEVDDLSNYVNLKDKIRI
jgi:hypothetical protein